MRKVLLIAKRDYLQTVSSKAFLFGLILLPLIFGGSFLAISLANRGNAAGAGMSTSPVKPPASGAPPAIATIEELESTVAPSAPLKKAAASSISRVRSYVSVVSARLRLSWPPSFTNS